MPQRHGNNDPPLTCSNCGYEYQRGARFCAACGWLLEVEPKERVPSPFDSGRLLVLDALQQKQIEEVCHFLDRQFQAGSQILDQGIQKVTQKLASLALGPGAQGQPGGISSQIQPQSSKLATQAAPASPHAGALPVAGAPLLCLRCGAENRLQGRFCLQCGASLVDLQVPQDLVIAFGLASDKGRVREINEDRVQVWSAEIEGQPAWLAVLADGMGGEKAGEVASGMMIEVAAQRWQAIVAGQVLAGQERAVLAEMVQEANHRVHRAGKASSARKGMGTTVTLLLVWQGMAYLANVGDSRVYLFDTAGRINQITRDHSLVAVLVGIGQITPEEAAVHDQRNLLYRSIGREPTVEVDTFVRRLQPGDRLLLCSDGLTLHLQDQEIAEILKAGEPPSQHCQKLIATANERGGQDNVSVVLLTVEEGQPGPQGQGRSAGMVQSTGGVSEESLHVQG